MAQNVNEKHVSNNPFSGLDINPEFETISLKDDGTGRHKEQIFRTNEFRILLKLLKSMGRTCHRDDLHWHDNAPAITSHTVDSQKFRINKQLEKLFKNSEYSFFVASSYGVGYKIEVENRRLGLKGSDVFIDGRVLSLQNKKRSILQMLCENFNKPVSRNLFDHLADPGTRVLDTQVAGTRKYISKACLDTLEIKSVTKRKNIEFAAGYVFKRVQGYEGQSINYDFNPLSYTERSLKERLDELGILVHSYDGGNITFGQNPAPQQNFECEALNLSFN